MTLRARAKYVALRVRDSYWFIPSLLALAGLTAGLGLVFVDGYIGDAWLGRWEWFYGSRPAGARVMLSTIAGSTITVAGVVFSITLAAVTYASGQFGPRLLSNFIRDRGNQTTLGVFIGTYLYCLVVLRTIRSAEETSADTGGAVAEAFVPHLAMTVGLFLAIASTAVLIYFVHHVTDGIHINNVIARLGHKLVDVIRSSNDEQEEAGQTAVSTGLSPARTASGTTVPSEKSGYIESIDFESLLATACEHKLLVAQLLRPGDFVARGHPLLEIVGDAGVDEEIAHQCASAFSIAGRRTDYQDPLFAVDELVEISARALSPGVNDPFTAVACIDWLGAALAELDRCRAPELETRDEAGEVRILLTPLQFDDFVESSFGRLQAYVTADPNVRQHTLETLDRLARNAVSEAHRIRIRAEADDLRKG